MNEKTKDRTILRTVVAVLVFLLFMFAQGAAAVIGQLEGITSIMVRGGVIWSLVIVTCAFFLIRDRSLAGIGFRRMKQGSCRQMLFFIPVLMVALSAFTGGFNPELGGKYVLANIFFTLSIGMAEEIYCRGIICGMWLKKGVVKAMLVSAVIFALCHLLNIMGGAGLPATILQICFAFVYGCVFALIYAYGGSLVPLVLLHAMHDFCVYVSGDIDLTGEIILGAVQFIILGVYLVVLLRRCNRSSCGGCAEQSGT